MQVRKRGILKAKKKLIIYARDLHQWDTSLKSHEKLNEYNIIYTEILNKI